MNKKVFFSLLIASTLFLTNNSGVFSQEITINSKSIKKTQAKGARERAEKAFKNKEFSDAVGYYKDLIKEEPSNQDFIYRFAISLYETQDYETSKKQLEKLLSSSNSQYKADAKKYLENIKNGNFAKKARAKITIVKQESKGPKAELSNDDGHYLCNPNDPSIFTDGSFRRWEEDDMPIKIYIPKVPQKFQGDSKVNYPEVVKQAFKQWPAKANFIKLSFVSSEDDANIVIKWLEYFKVEEGYGSAWGLAHLPEYDKSKGKRFADIKLATKAQPGSALFSTEATNFGDEEIIKLAVHEFGHALGLVHSYGNNDNLDIMAPVFSPFKREISARDLASLKKLYELPKGATVTCK
ncbi:MAG: matrixin family metalloprotease [Cyanobacteriota bacterium]